MSATRGAGSDSGAAGDDADVLVGGKAAGGVGVLVDAVEDATLDGFKTADAEAEQDAALYPGVDPPAERRGGIGLRRANPAAVELVAQLGKGTERGRVADRGSARGKVAFDLWLKWMLCRHVLA